MWIAGLLEGEGCFGKNSNGFSPRIQVGMTDEDVIKHIGQLLKQNVTGPYQQRPNHKPVWYVALHGTKARGWMMILYQFMGVRRQAAIRKALTEWRKIPNRGRRSNHGKMPTLDSKVRQVMAQLVLL